eukprot:1969218-Rhodomonas_salina.1
MRRASCNADSLELGEMPQAAARTKSSCFFILVRVAGGGSLVPNSSRARTLGVCRRLLRRCATGDGG